MISIIFIVSIIFIFLINYIIYLKSNITILQHDGQIDFLTKVLNKMTIYDKLETMIKSNKTFSLVIFDIDNFKQINDKFGHVAGDEILKEISTLIQANIRGTDYFGRFGGDEFILICPRTYESEISIVAEKIRTIVANNTTTTLSIGGMTYKGGSTNICNVLEIADKGLYKSKAKGKNYYSFGGIINNV